MQRKESSILRFTLTFYYVLTNLQFALKFIYRFIIGECAFFSNEVKNQFVVTVVANMTPNQLRIPHHDSYVWFALKKKIPLVFNLVVYLFPLPET